MVQRGEALKNWVDPYEPSSAACTSARELAELLDDGAGRGHGGGARPGDRGHRRRARGVPPRVAALAPGRLPRRAAGDQRRRRRDRVAGLGRDAHADVRPLGRAQGVRRWRSSTCAPARRPGSRAPCSRSRASTRTDSSRRRRACTGWCGSRRSTRRRGGTPPSPRCSSTRTSTTTSRSTSATRTSRWTSIARRAPAAST